MTKAELVAHLANLTFIFDHHERLGTTKNPLLVEEFQNCHTTLIDTIKKEKEDATTRKSGLVKNGIDKDRADLPRD